MKTGSLFPFHPSLGKALSYSFLFAILAESSAASRWLAFGEGRCLSKQGIRLVVIGSGAPRYAKAFRESVGGTVPIYTDPELQTFCFVLQARSGGTVEGSDVEEGNRSVPPGVSTRQVQGDAQQLWGVGRFGHGEVLYEYTSEFAGDHPELDQVLEAMA